MVIDELGNTTRIHEAGKRADMMKQSLIDIGHAMEPFTQQTSDLVIHTGNKSNKKNKERKNKTPYDKPLNPNPKSTSSTDPLGSSTSPEYQRQVAEEEKGSTYTKAKKERNSKKPYDRNPKTESSENERRLREEELLRLRGEQLVSNRLSDDDKTKKEMIKTIKNITKQSNKGKPRKDEKSTDIEEENTKQQATAQSKPSNIGRPKKDENM